jgi:hypothetical protein
MATQDSMPDIRPRAGYDLLEGIERVLPRLDGPGDPAELAENLRTALVRCTACGDIARVREQADAIRRAAGLLRTAPEQAGAVLVKVRTDLLSHSA